MKNLIYIIALISIASFTQAQEMSWVPSKYIANTGCIDETDCADNMVCYKLQYTPSNSGTLTSYTTGFIVSCDDRVNAVKVNSSCVMTDKSEEVMACEQYGKIMLNCSGNTGGIEVVEDKPIYIHQICVQLERGKHSIMIEESSVVQLTASLSSDETGAKTEFADYKPFKVINNTTFCDNSDINLTLSADLLENGMTSLSWEPAKESPDGYYTIYHSIDGEAFEEIGEVSSEIRSQTSVYKYKREIALESYGEHVFTVKYTHADGTSGMSNRANVFYKDVRFTLSVAPNPTVSHIRLLVTSPEETVNMNVMDMNGKLALTQSVKTDVEEFVDLRSLKPGIYNVSVLSGKDVLTEKLIVID